MPQNFPSHQKLVFYLIPLYFSNAFSTDTRNHWQRPHDWLFSSQPLRLPQISQHRLDITRPYPPWLSSQFFKNEMLAWAICIGLE
jgi:hypothetical protein